MKQTKTFIVTKLDESNARWFGCPIGAFMIQLHDVNNPGLHPGWFPIDLVSTVAGGKYTCIIPGRTSVEIYKSGSMGSQTIGTTNKDLVIDILTKNGYTQVVA